MVITGSCVRHMLIADATVQPYCEARITGRNAGVDVHFSTSGLQTDQALNF